MAQTSLRQSLALCAAATFLFVVTSTPGATVPSGFADVVVAGGFTNVSSMDVASDGRIFVGQQNGLVRVVKNGAVLPASFVSLGVNTANERGLVGITLDPGFSSNHFVYLHYTTNSGASVVQRVSRFTASGDVAAPGSELILIETDPFTDDQEVGGALGFGADGMLYVGIGQCGLSNSVQIANSLFGKVLRIQRDGVIPADNPFFNVNTGKNRAVWALGFRNPFSLSFQRSTGRLFINDVGQMSREEINEGVAGGNYGWPTCEGACSPSNPSFRDPVATYGHTNGQSAIVGGVFYDPPAALFPTQFVGKYFLADYTAAWIKLLDPANTNVTLFATNLPPFTVDLHAGPDGALYYLSRNGAASALGGAYVGKIVYLPVALSLISTGAVWKYLDTGPANLDPAWIQPAFDDSTWSNGVAQLGWGPNGEATLVRSNRGDSSRIITTYFRKSFVMSNTAPYSNLVVSLARDDGGIVYLNGVEILRNNMPAGVVSASTLASFNVTGADERAPYGGVADASLLINGLNVVAAEIHQQAITAATDMTFDLSLVAVDGRAALRARSAGGNVTLSYPAWATRFTLEASDTLPGVNWTVVSTNGATLVGGELQLSLSPAGAQKFFRLRSP